MPQHRTPSPAMYGGTQLSLDARLASCGQLRPAGATCCGQGEEAASPQKSHESSEATSTKRRPLTTFGVITTHML